MDGNSVLIKLVSAGWAAGCSFLLLNPLCGRVGAKRVLGGIAIVLPVVREQESLRPFLPRRESVRHGDEKKSGSSLSLQPGTIEGSERTFALVDVNARGV